MIWIETATFGSHLHTPRTNATLQDRQTDTDQMADLTRGIS